MLRIKLEMKRKITYSEIFFWFLETVEFSTSASAAIYWQQTCPCQATFAFPRTQKLWKWTERKSPIFASKVKSLVCCSYSFSVKPYCMFHSFRMHPFSLEDLGGTLNWTLLGSVLQRLYPWCWKRVVVGRKKQDLFLPCSLFPLCLYLLRAMLLVHVHSPSVLF